MSHNFTLFVYPGMVQAVDHNRVPPETRGKRGKVTVFTPQARKRMIQKFFKIVFKTVTFVTLTYPSEYPTSALVYKRHLQTWKARLERKYGKIRTFWRLEFQKRGAPHYHLLFLDPPWIEKEWLSRSWYEVVGSQDERHLRLGTNIRTVAKAEGSTGAVMAYVSKYIAKGETGEVDRHEWTGRYWGSWHVKEEDPIQISVDISGVVCARHCAIDSRVYPSSWEPPDRFSWSVFGGDVGSVEYRRRFLGEFKRRKPKGIN